MKRTLLWITPKWPLPANDGSRVATTALISSLAKRGHSVDLLAIAGEREAVDPARARNELGTRLALVLRRKDRFRNSLLRSLQLLKAGLTMPHIPITMQPYAAPRLRAALSALLSLRCFSSEIEGRPSDQSITPGWDAIVYEGPHPAMHSSLLGEFRRPAGAGKIVYRAQNVESLLWQRKLQLADGMLQKILLSHQCSLVKIFEESLVKAADAVAAVSSADLARFESIKRDLTGSVVPVGYDFDTPLAWESHSCEVLFLGRLDWPPNREGLIWLLENVWPQVALRRTDLTLTIAGSGDGAWIKPYLALDNLNFLGCVPDPALLYARSVVALVPIFYGGGTRVKAIEAGRFGRAVLSTAMGIEGLGLEPDRHYLRAETPGEWIETLLSLNLPQAERLGRNAFQRMQADFSGQHAADQFELLIDKMMQGC